MAKETDIELTVGLSASDVKQSAKELGNSIKQIFESSAGTAMDSKMQKLQQSMAQTTSKAQGLIDKMTKLESTQVPTQEYKELEKQIEKTEAQIAKMQEKWDKAQATGKPLQGTQLEQFRYDAAQLENTLVYAKEEMDELVAAGKAFRLGSDSEQYQKLSNELAGVNNQSRILINTWEQGQNSMKEPVEGTERSLGKFNKSLKESIRNIFRFKSATKSASSGLSGFNSGITGGIKSLVKYGLGISSLFVLFSKLRSAAAEGIKSLVQWEGQNGRLNRSISGLQSAIATLKNNIGAMVAPLVNALAPALTKIINLISVAIQKISMFIALLSGKKTITVANKVQSDYAGSLDKTAKSAKKAEKALKGYLSPLDEINKYESQKDDEDGGGGGGGAAGPTFSEMPIDENLYKWLEKLQSLINYLKKLWGKFKEGFFEGLGDWEPRLARLKQGLVDIGNALYDIWTDPRVLASADKYIQSVSHMLGTLVGAAASIGLTIATNLVAGLGDYLKHNTERIKQFLIDAFDIGTEINDLLSTLFVDVADIFSVFADENGIRITENLIGIFTDAFMAIWLLAEKLGRDLLDLIVTPINENKDHLKEVLDDILGFTADILDPLKEDLDYLWDEINRLYDETIKPFMDDLTSGISDLVDVLLDAYDQYIAPIWRTITEELSQFSDQYMKPLIDSIMNFLRPLIDLLKLLWNQVLQPLLAWFMDKFVAYLGTGIKFIWDLIKTVAKVISAAIEGILNILGALLQFVVDVFTKGWDNAWEGLKKRFCDIWDGIKKKLIDIVNSLVDTLNSFFDWLSDTINFFTDGINSLTGWIAGKTGLDIATSIPSLHIPHVPHLAQGAVIPPNKEFLAMLGDQKSGTNIETPLSTMIDAFNQALAQNGGAGGVKQITFVLPDRREIAKYAIEGGRVIQTSTGRNPFDLA